MQQPLSSQYKANSEAPFRGLASLLALQGRKGDTRLVHMTDSEVRAMAATGRMTINPDTGLPEAFNLSSLLPIVLAIAGTMVAPGIGTALGASVGAGTVGGAVAGAIGAGVGSTAGNLLIGKSGEDALKSGLISAGTAGIGSIASGPALEAMSGTAGLEGAAGTAVSDAAAGTIATDAANYAGNYGSFGGEAGFNEYGATAATDATDGYASLSLPPQDAATLSPYYADKAESINAKLAADQTAIDSGTRFRVTKGSTSMVGPDFKENQLLTDAQAAQATNGKYGLLTAGEGAAKDMSVAEASLENIKTLGSSKTPYIKGAISGGLGLALTPPEYKKEAPRPPPTFQDYTLTGGELLPGGEGQDAPLSSAQALAIALGNEKRKPVLSQYAYTPREASSGGLIGLFGGGKVAYLEDGSDGDDGDDGNDGNDGTGGGGTGGGGTGDTGTGTGSDPDNDPGFGGTDPDNTGVAGFGGLGESYDPDNNPGFGSIANPDYGPQYGPPEPEAKGLAGLITGYVEDKVAYAKENPIATALDVAFGFAPGIGWANTISNVLGGPTVGKGITAMGRGVGQAISPDMSPEAIDERDAKAAYDYSFGKDKTTESFGGYGQQDSATLKRKREEEGSFKEGGSLSYHEGRVDGAGDGMSDNVVYRVEGGNPDIAMLSRDEYVLPADVVAMIGNGSSNAGSDKIDKFIKDLRKQSFGTAKQQREVKNSSKTGLSTLVH